MNLKKILFFLLLISIQGAYSQKTEELISLINSAKPDSNKVNLLNSLGRQYIIEGEYIRADSTLNLAIQLSRQIGFLKGEANALTNTGVLYWYQDDYPKALDNYFNALRIVERTGDKKLISRSLANIGLVYFNQGDHDKALKYYQQSLKLKEEIKDLKGSAILLGNIGDIHKKTKNYQKALENYFRAKKISSDLNETGLISLNTSNTGSIYDLQGNYDQALEFYLAAQELSTGMDDKVMISQTAISIGGIHLKKKNYPLAENYITKGLHVASSMGDLDNKKNAHQLLFELYNTQGQYQKALSHYMDFTATRDSIFNEEKTKKTVRSEMNFDFDKKQTAEKILQAKKDAIAEEELKRQKMQRNYFITGFLMMLFLAGIIFRSYRQKQKANIIIARQKEEVHRQKDMIEEKSKEITDSIIYAKRLQEAILPPQSYIDTYLPENFVLYLPKDIVAGDFYWMEHKDDTTYIAVADCTGHGVPGAMVSVICSNALNRAVVEFGLTEPGEILDKTRELVLYTFIKSHKDVKDGMDISLCTIRSGTVKWAGAYNPLWYLSKGVLQEITANKQPIGKTDNPLSFTTHTLHLQKGDILYLFTDGYADQFGGEKGKKFKYKPLKELLIKNAERSTVSQRNALEVAFELWKGNLEQVDDVCLIGIRI
ncbi:MAG: tetratricopeptide repeat protein [Bacteroidota bacterium]|nr:tetratricopeptide repeat protein [Bacteroidota bacterium]